MMLMMRQVLLWRFQLQLPPPTVTIDNADYVILNDETLEITINTPGGFDPTTEIALVLQKGTDVDYPSSPTFSTCVDPTTLTLTSCSYLSRLAMPKDTLANWGNSSGYWFDWITF